MGVAAAILTSMLCHVDAHSSSCGNSLQSLTENSMGNSILPFWIQARAKLQRPSG